MTLANGLVWNDLLFAPKGPQRVRLEPLNRVDGPTDSDDQASFQTPGIRGHARRDAVISSAAFLSGCRSGPAASAAVEVW